MAAPLVPNTISNAAYAALQRRAALAEKDRGGMFTTKAVTQRIASERQRLQARWS